MLTQACPNITTKEMISLGNIHNSIHDIKFAHYQGNTMKTDLLWILHWELGNTMINVLRPIKAWDLIHNVKLMWVPQVGVTIKCERGI